MDTTNQSKTTPAETNPAEPELPNLNPPTIDAEKDDDRLYLYEVAANFMFTPHDYQEDVDTLTMDSPQEEARFYRLDDHDYTSAGRIQGITIPFADFKSQYGDDIYIRTVPARQLLDYQAEADKFKWTFVRNGENYVFEALEKI